MGVYKNMEDIMTEILVKYNGTFFRQDPALCRELPRMQRIQKQIQETRKIPGAEIYLKKGRKVRMIRANHTFTQKPLFLCNG
jgi:hypothetical protein